MLDWEFNLSSEKCVWKVPLHDPDSEWRQNASLELQNCSRNLRNLEEATRQHAQ
ncbi:hypothetical protein JNUCC0626_06865 [Lentzea sp. JNUCC 0626]|uniref:hypothetical protein n=1 Tax=Lentzea sp. JNUCC 0626 TaxID=3367513 RepID=UPI0037492761